MRNACKPQGEFVDLHMHSTYSDGALGVKSLIDFCMEQSLSAIAITDHDNIDGYAEGRDYAEEMGIEFIPGVEISSSVGGCDIHILGYYFDPTHLKLNQTLLQLQAKRKVRAMEIVRKLNEIGIDITYEKVSAKAKDGSIGRAHIATLLVEEEYVSSFQEAFNKYLGNNVSFIADLDPVKMTPIEAIQLIIEAGGVPVMAHPSKTRRDDLISSMVENGLKGIETYCHNQSNSCYQKYRDIARKYDLVCSGGADFHVKREDGKHAPGSLNVPYKVLSMFKDIKAHYA